MECEGSTSAGCFSPAIFEKKIQPKNHLNFSEEPETDKSNEANEDLETLPSSCYASAKDNTSKSEVDKCGDTNTKNNLTPESGINSPNCELTSTDLQSPRLKIINRNVSVWILRHAIMRQLKIIKKIVDFFTRVLFFREKAK